MFTVVDVPYLKMIEENLLCVCVCVSLIIYTLFTGEGARKTKGKVLCVFGCHRWRETCNKVRIIVIIFMLFYHILYSLGQCIT